MNIVIVDDSKIARKILGEVLEKLGHSVIGQAANGLEGLEICQQLNPDFVFCDIEMPKMNGIEMLLELKQKKTSINIIMITSLVKKNLTEKLIRDGAFCVLKKPITADKIKEVLTA